MKLEFDAIPMLEEQIEAVVLVTTEKAIEKYHHKNVAKEWMNLKEGAAYAGVSYNSFIRFRVLGLKVCEIDSIKRVSKKEIDRFLNENSY